MEKSIEDKNALDKARKIINHLLKIRLRSENEVRQRLKQKNVSPEIIETTMDEFKKIDLINDRYFARMWINDRLAKPLGAVRIAYELKTKGVSEEIYKEELEEILSVFDEESIALKLAEKRAQLYKKIDRLKRRHRLYGFLSRRGFHQKIIQKIIQKF